MKKDNVQPLTLMTMWPFLRIHSFYHDGEGNTFSDIYDSALAYIYQKYTIEQFYTSIQIVDVKHDGDWHYIHFIVSNKLHKDTYTDLI